MLISASLSSLVVPRVKGKTCSQLETFYRKSPMPVVPATRRLTFPLGASRSFQMAK